LSGRGLCDELITRPEESYRLWCVVVCDLETSRIGAPYTYDISCLRVNRAGKTNKTVRYGMILYTEWMKIAENYKPNRNEEEMLERGFCLS